MPAATAAGGRLPEAGTERPPDPVLNPGAERSCRVARPVPPPGAATAITPGRADSATLTQTLTPMHHPTPAEHLTSPGGPWLTGADGLCPQGLWLADGTPVAEHPEFAEVDWTADLAGDDADPAPAVREVLKAGFWDRSRGDGAGFAAGGAADTLPPGPVLAGLAGDTWAAGLGRLTDDELIGILRAARRLASWAASMELAAAGELWRRRTAEEDAGDRGSAERTGDEIAAALTLTGRAAGCLLDLAIVLHRLQATAAALACGDIDYPGPA